MCDNLPLKCLRAAAALWTCHVLAPVELDGAASERDVSYGNS
jgi:hypothetical protein